MGFHIRKIFLIFTKSIIEITKRVTGIEKMT